MPWTLHPEGRDVWLSGHFWRYVIIGVGVLVAIILWFTVRWLAWRRDERDYSQEMAFLREKTALNADGEDDSSDGCVGDEAATDSTNAAERADPSD